MANTTASTASSVESRNKEFSKLYQRVVALTDSIVLDDGELDFASQEEIDEVGRQVAALFLGYSIQQQIDFVNWVKEAINPNECMYMLTYMNPEVQNQLLKAKTNRLH
jgi:hypothetical protein